MPERRAVISDVHGNLTALEAVLADVDARGITRVPYDVESEVAVARKQGMPDADAYALELHDQVYRGATTPPG